MTKNQKIANAITLLETLTRAQYVTGAITGSNTNIIMSVQLLKDAITVQPTERKPRKKKTPVQTDLKLEQTKEKTNAA